MRLLPFCQTCGEAVSKRADRCRSGADPHVESAVCGQPGCPCAVPAVRPCVEFHDLGLWPCTGCGWPRSAILGGEAVLVLRLSDVEAIDPDTLQL